MKIKFCVAACAVVALLSCGSGSGIIDVVQEKVLSENWKIKSSKNTSLKGEQLSLGEKDDSSSWKNAAVPGTVLNALVQAGVYQNVYEGNNLAKIPVDQFKSSWWYTTSFELKDIATENHYQLNFDGINYRANVWLNGKLIADSAEISGAFNRFSLLIDSVAQGGSNHLAIEVFPPSNGDYSIGFVDWAPTPPDNNMGIFRNVTLKITKAAEIKNTFVQSKINLQTLAEADLTVTTEVINHDVVDAEVVVGGKIGAISISKKVSLKAKEKQVVNFSSKEFPQLHIQNPKLWWPNGYGDPAMYELEISVNVNSVLSCTEKVNFGVREVSDYFNENGHRGYKINGKEILIKGAGWVDDLLLGNTAAYDEAQIKYVKDMNLNCIRFEAFWGKDQRLYDLCDRHGILLMAGFSCHWEWQDYIGTPCGDQLGCATQEKAISLLAGYWKNQITWLRNHPSLFAWVGGSDFLPHPDLEKKYLSILKEIDPTRPYLGSAKTYISSVSGPSGVKMNGPYDYVPPMYWYTDTVRGGAFGFNTETGPGPQVPVLWTINKMFDGKAHWPIDSTWDYHAGRHAFGNLNRYMKSFNNRYGASASLEDFSLFTQAASYEAIRPMFEAFRVNRPNATGVVQWMLNSAWLDTYWQLYDAYLMPTGAYYGTKTACASVQGIYNYGNQSVYLANDTKDSVAVKLLIEMYSSDSKLLYTKEVSGAVAGNSSAQLLVLPALAKGVSFLNIVVQNTKGEKISSNFYWLSSKKDKMEAAKDSASWIYTPAIEFADYTALRTLPKAKFKVEYNGKGEVTVTNTSDKIAFFIEFIAMDNKTKEPVRPVIWSDNYISLMPGEVRVLKVSLPSGEMGDVSFNSKGINTVTE
ncbi:MAG: glycoside hydrolase family 2 [Bacteroidetes bacterium]|nr:glycoside hydrolase family 2 [Bacteroidota bacterium]